MLEHWCTPESKRAIIIIETTKYLKKVLQRILQPSECEECSLFRLSTTRTIVWPMLLATISPWAPTVTVDGAALPHWKKPLPPRAYIQIKTWKAKNRFNLLRAKWKICHQNKGKKNKTKHHSHFNNFHFYVSQVKICQNDLLVINYSIVSSCSNKALLI